MAVEKQMPIAKNTAPGDVQASSWHALSHFVIRKAGFPFDWLEQLATPVCLEVTDRLLAKQQAWLAHRTQLLQTVFPESVREAYQAHRRDQLRALTRLRRKVGRGTLKSAHLAQYEAVLPIPLHTQIQHFCASMQELKENTAQAEQLFQQQYALGQQQLRTYIEDSLFQEALFLSNPDMYRNSILSLLQQRDLPLNGSLERKLWAYLQRFCGKNDTASFFGPLNYGQVVPEQEEPVRIVRSKGKYQRREAFLSFWVVNRLAKLMSTEPEIKRYLCPRLHPQCFWHETTVYSVAHDRHIHLNRVQQAILHHANGSTTIQEIADHIHLSVTEVASMIEKMVAAKILICHIEVPSTIFRPLTALMQRTLDLPDTWPQKQHWLALLQQFEHLRQDFTQAALPERQKILALIDTLYLSTTHEPPRRNAGGTYADRTPIYEECLGTLETFQMSEAFFTTLLQRLAAVLDLSAGYGTLLGKHYQAVGRDLFSELSPDHLPIPYIRFIQEMQKKQRSTPAFPMNEELEDFRAAFTQLVQQRSDGSRACLTATDIQQLLARITQIPHCHISPDIMLAASNEENLRQGNYQVVLGESHQVIYVWGSQLYFYERRAEAEAEIQEHLRHMPEYDAIATILNERQHKGLLYEAFPGTFIEVYATPSAQIMQRVALRDLEVALVEEQLVLRHIHTKIPLRIYTAGDEQMHLWAFAFPRAMSLPVAFPGHTPRIEIGGTIYQRETWRLASTEWGKDVLSVTSLELMLRSQQIRQRYNIPRYVYIHVSSEPKPFFLDFANIFSLNHFRHLLLHNAEVKLTEMLPAPNDLWMSEQDGQYCCEFRLTACRY